MKKHTCYLVIVLFVVSCRSEPKLDPGRYVSEEHGWCYGIEIDENSDSLNFYIFPSYPTDDTTCDWRHYRSGTFFRNGNTWEVGNLETDFIQEKKMPVPIHQKGDTICLNCFLLQDAFMGHHRHCGAEESKYVKIR